MPTPTAAHLEVERTFELDTGAELPDLRVGGVVESLPGPSLHLVATYHDSVDLRLLAAGITLRRRLGGSDEGWHLKVTPPGGRRGSADTRLELRRPVGRSPHPPVAIRRLVHGVSRDAGLVPVAEVSTQRTERQLRGPGGQVLAVTADDQVTSRLLLGAPAPPVGWRELEVELVDGDRDLLVAVTRALVAAGIAESSVQSKARRALGELAGAGDPEPTGAGAPAGAVLAGHLRRLRTAFVVHDLHVRAHQPDGVHQLRIAARRIRSVLAAHRPLLDRSRTRALESELRWVGRQLSPARDAEVIAGQLFGLLDGEPAGRSTRTARRLARRHLTAQAKQGAGEVEAVLGSQRYRQLLDDLADLVADPPLTGKAARPARGRLRRRLRASYERLASRMIVAGELSGAERERAMHEARKAAKRVRYAAEVAEPVVGRRAARLRRRTKALQQELGAHRDTVVIRGVVRALAADPDADPSATFGLGRLHARLEQRGAELDRAALAAWRRLARPKVAGWLR